jgi:hypothetical protein
MPDFGEILTAISPPTRRDFVFPGCGHRLYSDDAGVTTKQFQTIALELAWANPDAQIHFSLEIKAKCNPETST